MTTLATFKLPWRLAFLCTRRQKRAGRCPIRPLPARQARYLLRQARYDSARFKFSIASSTSAVLLKPSVTLSTPALLNANFIAA